MSDKLSDSAHALLTQAIEALDGNTIPPMPAVDRETYLEFESVVTRLRGKWKRGKGHVFPYHPRAALEAVASSRTLPANNPLAYFPTPQALSDDLVGLMSRPAHVFEPSAGSGNLVAAAHKLWPAAKITAVELDPLNVALLRARFDERVLPSWYDPTIFGEPGKVEIIEGSCMDVDASALSEPIDLVLMNPPFTLESDQAAWLTHFRHAWNLLAPGGEIMCIAPAGTWESSARKFWIEAREWLYSIGFTRLKLEAGAFESSGTGVSTLVIRASKPTEREYTEEHNGYLSFFAWRAWLSVDGSQPMIDRGRKLIHLDRNAPEVLSFARDACKLSCDEGDECPANDRVIDQVLDHWDSWRAEYEPLEASEPSPQIKSASKGRASAKTRKPKA